MVSALFDSNAVTLQEQPEGETSKNLRLLILEDRPADAELCERELERAGLRFTTTRVDTRAGFEAALDRFVPDLIISDFSLPAGFDGLAALELAQRKPSTFLRFNCTRRVSWPASKRSSPSRTVPTASTSSSRSR